MTDGTPQRRLVRRRTTEEEFLIDDEDLGLDGVDEDSPDDFDGDLDEDA